MLETASEALAILKQEANKTNNPLSSEASIYSEVKDNALIVTALTTWFGRTDVEVRILFVNGKPEDRTAVIVKIECVNDTWNTVQTFQKKIMYLRDFNVYHNVISPLKNLHALNGK